MEMILLTILVSIIFGLLGAWVGYQLWGKRK